MTDKEKARHYDESIERARQFYRTPYLEDSASVVSYIFPELKVENDNRIKNELIEFVKSRGSFKQEYIDWLEKQGSEESVDPDTLIQQRVDALTDIAETKFHEGDWVVTDMNNIFQIKAYDNGYYIIGNGTAYNMSYVDRCWHLWSIKDAKDGDVLVTDKRQPFIFNGHYDKDTDYIYAYCGISGLVKDNAFYAIEDCADEEFAVWCTIESVCPATKEQCDILFQKMKEAGYEWDADAKQLKKIAQKSTGWNEDDEKYVKDLVGYFTEAMSLLHNEDEVASWLKSLKDRVQPEQEWKKEDKEMLTEIILDLKVLKHRDTGEAGKTAYQKEIDWLENRVLPKSQKCIVKL